MSPNSGRTVQRFLDSLLTANDGGDSSRLATLAKAAALYERADRLALFWEKGGFNEHLRLVRANRSYQI